MKKRNNVFRWLLFVAIFAWAIYSLIPSYKTFLSKDIETIEKISKKADAKDVLQKKKNGITLTKVEENLLSSFTGDESNKNFELTEEELEALNNFEEQKKKSISLGLDLQGGMHLVLEIDYYAMLKNDARIKDKQLNDLLDEAKNITGSDKDNFLENVKNVFAKEKVLLTKYFGRRTDTADKVIAELDSSARKGIVTTLEVLRNRINEFGISEPSIQKHGDHRIIVELPGVKDPRRAKKIVNRAAFLEFKIVAENEVTTKMMDKIDLIVKKKRGLITDDELDSTKVETTKTNDVASDTTKVADKKDSAEDASKLFGDKEGTTSDSATSSDLNNDTAAADFVKEHPFKGLFIGGYRGELLVSDKNMRNVNEILLLDEVQSELGIYEFVWSGKATVNNEEEFYEIILVKKKAESGLNGTYINNATASLDQSGTATGSWKVNMDFNRIGAKKFAEATGRNVNKRLAIILDGRFNSAPNINGRIAGGSAVITGSFDAQEARDLAIVLRAGALKAPLEFIEEREIGASLGNDSIRKGLTASAVGLLLVMIFMIFWYKLSGVFSVVALALNLIFLVATLAYFKAVLTLPGIAGVILTIGMAVDANVLIFERIKEELRDKKTIYSAVNAGYEKAFNTIFDANLTTLIAGIVLYQFGTGPIKGFALTLMIGIGWSMFTAIVMTRLLTDIFVNRESKKISI